MSSDSNLPYDDSPAIIKVGEWKFMQQMMNNVRNELAQLRVELALIKETVQQLRRRKNV